jgi:hypothetical protein
MSTFGDIERTFADLYEYRWAIGAGVLVFIAAVIAFGYWRGWHQVIWRNRLPLGIVSAPLLVITIWLGWSLGSPLFTNVTVEEEFPFALNAVVPAGMEREDVEEAMAGMAKVSSLVTEAMPGNAAIAAGAALSATGGNGLDGMIVLTEANQAALQEGLAMVSGVEMVDAETMEKAVGMIQGAIDQPTVSGGAQPEVRQIKQGDFRDADSFHRGSGHATIYTTPDGSHLLRLENLDVTNGPALHVFLSPHADPGSSSEVKTEGYIDLGDLKGNRGNQNYPIPSGVDVSVFNSVVIYCVPFSVVFSVATLQEA